MSSPALLPIAILSPPVIAPRSASRPIPILLVPEVIPLPTLSPIAMFPEPENEPLLRVLFPKATLSVPVGKLPSSLTVPLVIAMFVGEKFVTSKFTAYTVPHRTAVVPR